MKRPYTILITELDNNPIKPRLIIKKHWKTSLAAHTHIKDYNSNLASKSKGKIPIITKYEVLNNNK